MYKSTSWVTEMKPRDPVQELLTQTPVSGVQLVQIGCQGETFTRSNPVGSHGRRVCLARLFLPFRR